MTEKQKSDIVRRARQDAAALKSGWPVRGCPFQDDEEAALYKGVFECALKEGRK